MSNFTRPIPCEVKRGFAAVLYREMDAYCTYHKGPYEDAEEIYQNSVVWFWKIVKTEKIPIVSSLHAHNLFHMRLKFEEVNLYRKNSYPSSNGNGRQRPYSLEDTAGTDPSGEPVTFQSLLENKHSLVSSEIYTDPEECFIKKALHVFAREELPRYFGIDETLWRLALDNADTVTDFIDRVEIPRRTFYSRLSHLKNFL